MSRPHMLYRVEGGKRQPKPDAVMDLETAGLYGEEVALMIAYPEDGTVRTEFFASFRDFLPRLLSRWGKRYTWWAHNGTGYDYDYLVQYLDDILEYGYTLELVSSQDVQIGIRLTRGDDVVQLRDFFRLVPDSLKRLTELFDVPHKKLVGAINWEAERFEPTNLLHMEYLRHDVIGLWEVIGAFRRLWRDVFGTDIGWTTPASAMKAFRATIPEGHVYFCQRKAVRDWIRQAYYGGMVRVGRTTWQAEWEWVVRQFDRNSMYPSVMLEGVPVGPAIRTRRYVVGKPGFYHVRAVVPEDIPLTVLPYRTREGVVFPTGQFETYCSSLEIDLARELGCEVEVVEGYYFPRIEKPFDDFIQRCMEIRYTHKGDALELVAKLAQNSLYGKFGSREEVTRIFATRDRAKATAPGVIPYTNPRTGEMVPDVYQMKEVVEYDYAFPEWAAWITAQARVTLARTALPYARAGKLLYTDTDSIKVIMRREDTPTFEVDAKRYGAWKDEGVVTTWYCAGPKTYAALVEGKGWVIHTKGVPRQLVSADMVRRAAEGETVPVTFRLARRVRHYVTHRQRVHEEFVTRSLTRPSEVLGWVLEAEGFRPKRAAELPAFQKRRVVSEEEIRAREEARWMQEWVREERRKLRQAILPVGIEDTDYEDIPRVLRRKGGWGLDEWAQELGFESADSLYDHIRRLYRRSA